MARLERDDGDGFESISRQLEMFGLAETRRRAEVAAPTKSVRSRMVNRIERVHAILSEIPSGDDLAFLHSGLCQTCLPHSRPASDDEVWQRSAGRFHLLVSPGALVDDQTGRWMRVGVPYGTKARLIMLFLQTEAITSKSRTISLGDSMSSFLRSLGLSISGGPRGTMTAVREQCRRIAMCSFTLQWSGTDATGAKGDVILQNRIASGLELWRSNRDEWTGTVELSDEFFEHLSEHAVPLSKGGIAHLAGNSLGLDLYALFAYRLHRLKHEQHLSWAQIQSQIGAEYSDSKSLARRVREVLPEVHVAYPEAKVEVTRHGLMMRQSPPPVQKASVQGFRLIEGRAEKD